MFLWKRVALLIGRLFAQSLLSHYSTFKVLVVVKCETAHQDEVVEAAGAKRILEQARQTPHDSESRESANGYI